jgi:hypothetical protein
MTKATGPKVLHIRPYEQADGLSLVKDHREQAWALVNEVYGPGVTYEMDGKVVACAGIRTFGMGEIWAVFADGAKELKFTLGKESKRQVKEMMEQYDLWMLVATVDEKCAQTQRDFLEFLGFTKTECYTYRKE